MHDTISIAFADGHIEVIRALADELDRVRDDHSYWPVRYWAEVLIDSSGTGWAVCVDYGRLVATPDSLAALCRSLAGVGRKREREIAGRIKERARARGVDSSGWAGEAPVPKPSVPKSIDDVVAAWVAGKPMRSGNVRTDGMNLYSWNLRIGRTAAGRKIAIDYRGQISGSTSRHVGAATRAAVITEAPC